MKLIKLLPLIGIGIFIYLILLAIFSQKIYSGFLMQLIYLFDALIDHSDSLFSLVVRQDFLIQFIVGMVWTHLLVLVISGLLRLFNQTKNTSKYLHSLKFVKVNSQYNVFSFSEAVVFTAGFLNPHVYISNKVIDISTPDELDSILDHEQSHRHNFDPLKNLFIDFVSYITPHFPGKGWFFGQYSTLVEIGSDIHSQFTTSNPDSLISALIKIQESFQPVLYRVSHFSSQSERIKILIGQKKLSVKSILFSNLLMISILFVSASYLSRTEFFYQCQHLIKCFQNLVTLDHLSPSPLIKNQSCDFSSLSS